VQSFPPRLLLAAIGIEGYAVLAVELLAIRQLTPYVGNATDTIAIVIAAVLLPLAFGYEAGGRAKLERGDEAAIRRLLTRNLLIAPLILVFGLSHPFLVAFFATLDGMGLTHRLVQAAIHSSLFLVYPIYLLGQTLPLVAFCASGADMPRSTGIMLFVSTLGSFLGSVVSTLVLMTLLGVSVTVIITLGLLVALAAVIGWPTQRAHNVTIGAVALGALIVAANSPWLMGAYGIVSDNLHSQVRVVDNPAEGSRLLVINNSPSSKTAARPEHRFAYVRFIEDEVIKALDAARPRRILVIGAGGFTIGQRDRFHSYTYVDIDPALREVSERHFLDEPLTPNKTFVVEPARAYLRRNPGAYDLVVVDAFTNRVALPPDLVTREAFAAVREALAPGGRVVVNTIVSPDFADRFSRSLDATIRSAFPFVTRQVLGQTRFDGVANVLYLADGAGNAVHDVYTDDRNRAFLDQ
jgi:predicted membrane-bound spermidine synthase